MTIRLLALLLLLAPQSDPVRELIDRMRSDKPQERNRAYSQLQSLGKTALPALRHAAGDPDADLVVRARLLLKTFELRESLPPVLLRELPGLEDRLAQGWPEWTAALLETTRWTESGPAHPALRRSHLDALAAGALRGARTLEEIQEVCKIVNTGQLTGAEEELRRLLRHPDLEIRKSVMQILSNFRSESLIEDLPALLDDPELVGLVRCRLYRMQRARLIPVLLKQLAGRNLEAREAAAEILVDLRSTEGLSALVPFLHHPNPWLRRSAAQAVDELDPSDLVPRMLGVVADPDPVVRDKALRSLRRSRVPRISCFLRPMLKAPEADLRLAAIHAISYVDGRETVPDLIELLEDDDADIRLAAVRALRSFDARSAIPALLRRLTDPSDDVRGESAEALLRLGSAEILPHFYDLLRDPEASQRLYGLESLTNARTKEAVREVVRLLRDNDEEVRVGALRTLRYIRSPEAVEDVFPLLTWAEGEESRRAHDFLYEMELREWIPRYRELLEYEDSSAKVKAIQLLVQLEDLPSIPRLEVLTGNWDPDVRTSAYYGLAHLAGLDAVPALLRSRSEPDENARLQLGQALATVRAPEAVPLLVPFLSNPDLRSIASRSLRRLGDFGLIEALAPLLDHKDRDCRQTAVELLSRLDTPRVLPVVRKALNDEASEVRALALDVFLHLEAPEMIPDLLRCLADHDEDVRLKAVHALAWQRARDVVPALLALFAEDTPRVRSAVVEALGELSATMLQSKLPDLLRDRDWHVRYSALQAAGTADLREAIPALKEMMSGDELDLRPYAGCALVRLGERSGVEQMLKSNPENLFSLNRVRCPQVWDRLRNLPWTAPHRASSLAIWDRVASEAGLSLEVDPGVLRWVSDEDHVLRPRDGTMTLLESLQTTGGYLGVILESDGLRVVPRYRAEEFWRAWAEEERR